MELFRTDCLRAKPESELDLSLLARACADDSACEGLGFDKDNDDACKCPCSGMWQSGLESSLSRIEPRSGLRPSLVLLPPGPQPPEDSLNADVLPGVDAA